MNLIYIQQLDISFYFDVFFYSYYYSRWFSVCEEGLHALYHITACPDKIVGLLLIRLHADLAVQSHTTASLSRLIFLLGQTALNTLVYTEKIANITKKLLECNKSSKRKSVSKKAVVATAASPAPVLMTPAVGKKARSSSVGGRRSSVGGGLEEAEEMEMEMGLAASADADHEMVCLFLYIFVFIILC